MVAVIALLHCSPARADAHVILLRGWFGVFSTGMDKIGETLKAQGIRADVEGHLSWKTAVDDILRERAEGRNDALVLIGHSQGGNNVVDMARLLEAQNVPVALLITLAPFKQDPVPGNVVRAINYFQSGGWGDPLTAAPDFKGKLSNIDVKGDAEVSHINIDKSSRVQADIVRETVAVAAAKPVPPAAKPDARRR
jgi:predicted esterase